MTFLAVLAIAVALAMDAFAVAITAGARLPAVSLAHTLRLAGTFGFFQGAMPVAGWLLGTGVAKLIHSYDHWIAFILLVFVGGRMLWEAWEKRCSQADDCTLSSDLTKGASLLLLAIATSIDALAVGLSMAILRHSIWFPAAVIGIVCFIITACGLHLGRAVCSVSGNWTNRANALGGLVLIVIGLNIIHEHGVF